MRALLPLSCLCAAAAAQNPAATSCASFKVYWGLTGPSSEDPASPPLDNSTAGLPYLFEPTGQYLLKRNPGAALLPYCITQVDGSITTFNGGIPQNATAPPAAFLRALQAELTRDLEDAEIKLTSVWRLSRYC